MVHVLPPGEYGDVVSFLALFVLLHVPGVALSAAGALAPDRLARLTPRVAPIGSPSALALAVGCVPIGGVLGLPTGLVLLLGAAAPAAGADEPAARARLRPRAAPARDGKPRRRCRRSASSSASRWRMALGSDRRRCRHRRSAGYVGLARVRDRHPVASAALGRVEPVDPRPAAPRRTVTRAGALAVGLSFVAIAVLQSVDLLVANRVLDADGAAAFGVLSTIGGAAFFATATIPLVLMPAVVKGRDHAATAAVALTAGVGIGVAASARCSRRCTCPGRSARSTPRSSTSSARTSSPWRCSASCACSWPGAAA